MRASKILHEPCSMIVEFIRFAKTNEPSIMSKLNILLCVVFIASAANAFFVTENLNADLLKMENELANVYKKIDIDQQQANKNIEKIKEVCNVAMKKVFDDVAVIVEGTNDKVKKITTVSDDVDVSDCTKLTQQLVASAFSVTRAMTNCVTKKIAEAMAYVDDMKTSAKHLNSSLEALKTKGFHCFNDTNSLPTRAMALFCANEVGLEAGLAAAKIAPSTAHNLAGLANLLATLRVSLGLCVPTQAIAALIEESLIIIEKTNKCVKLKMNEIH